jgi:hypothetical protein
MPSAEMAPYAFRRLLMKSYQRRSSGIKLSTASWIHNKTPTHENGTGKLNAGAPSPAHWGERFPQAGRGLGAVSSTLGARSSLPVMQTILVSLGAGFQFLAIHPTHRNDWISGCAPGSFRQKSAFADPVTRSLPGRSPAPERLRACSPGRAPATRRPWARARLTRARTDTRACSRRRDRPRCRGGSRRR